MVNNVRIEDHDYGLNQAPSADQGTSNAVPNPIRNTPSDPVIPKAPSSSNRASATPKKVLPLVHPAKRAIIDPSHPYQAGGASGSQRRPAVRPSYHNQPGGATISQTLPSNGARTTTTRKVPPAFVRKGPVSPSISSLPAGASTSQMPSRTSGSANSAASNPPVRGPMDNRMERPIQQGQHLSQGVKRPHEIDNNHLPTKQKMPDPTTSSSSGLEVPSNGALPVEISPEETASIMEQLEQRRTSSVDETKKSSTSEMRYSFSFRSPALSSGKQLNEDQMPSTSSGIRNSNDRGRKIERNKRRRPAIENHRTKDSSYDSVAETTHRSGSENSGIAPKTRYGRRTKPDRQSYSPPKKLKNNKLSKQWKAMNPFGENPFDGVDPLKDTEEFNEIYKDQTIYNKLLEKSKNCGFMTTDYNESAIAVEKEVYSEENDDWEKWDKKAREEDPGKTEFKVDYVVACTQRTMGEDKPPVELVLKYAEYGLPSYALYKDNKTVFSVFEFNDDQKLLDMIELRLKAELGVQKFNKVYPNRYVPKEEGLGEGRYINNKRARYYNRLKATEWRINETRKGKGKTAKILICDWMDVDEDAESLHKLKFILDLVNDAEVEGILEECDQAEDLHCSPGCTCSMGEVVEDHKLVCCTRSRVIVEKKTGKLKFSTMKDGTSAETDHAYNVECVQECKCSCTNRMSQIPCKFVLVIFRAPVKNWTIMTASEIPVKGFIGKYAGVVSLEKSASSPHNKYDFSMDEKGIKTKNGKKFTNLNICSYEQGNETRFLSHSCSPNAKTELVMVKRHGPGYLLPIFRANRKILAGEEISVDYFSGKDVNCRAFFEYCSCGAKNCRFPKEEMEKNKGIKEDARRKTRRLEDSTQKEIKELMKAILDEIDESERIADDQRDPPQSPDNREEREMSDNEAGLDGKFDDDDNSEGNEELAGNGEINGREDEESVGDGNGDNEAAAVAALVNGNSTDSLRPVEKIEDPSEIPEENPGIEAGNHRNPGEGMGMKSPKANGSGMLLDQASASHGTTGEEKEDEIKKEYEIEGDGPVPTNSLNGGTGAMSPDPQEPFNPEDESLNLDEDEVNNSNDGSEIPEDGDIFGSIPDDEERDENGDEPSENGEDEEPREEERMEDEEEEGDGEEGEGEGEEEEDDEDDPMNEEDENYNFDHLHQVNGSLNGELPDDEDPEDEVDVIHLDNEEEGARIVAAEKERDRGYVIKRLTDAYDLVEDNDELLIKFKKDFVQIIMEHEKMHKKEESKTGPANTEGYRIFFKKLYRHTVDIITDIGEMCLNQKLLDLFDETKEAKKTKEIVPEKEIKKERR